MYVRVHVVGIELPCSSGKTAAIKGKYQFVVLVKYLIGY